MQKGKEFMSMNDRFQVIHDTQKANGNLLNVVCCVILLEFLDQGIIVGLKRQIFAKQKSSRRERILKKY